MLLKKTNANYRLNQLHRHTTVSCEMRPSVVTSGGKREYSLVSSCGI